LLLNDKPVDQNVLKIVDFGLATYLRKEEVLRAPTGTPLFMSPQALQGMIYDASADMWSCGIIVYTLLCGYPPFDGKTTQILTAKITMGNYCFGGTDWSEVSEEAKEIVRGLLKMAQTERLTAKGAKIHRWCMIEDEGQAPLPEGVRTKLMEFREMWRFEADADAASSKQKKPQAVTAEVSAESGLQAFLDNIWKTIGGNIFCCASSGSETCKTVVVNV